LDQLDVLGTDLWMGYSFGWHAALLARAGRGEQAAHAVRAFQQAFTFPNGFHTNGDWRKRGYGTLPFGVFTLEGNSAAVAGVQAMLLESRLGRLRVFPAVPASWRTAEFSRLLANGGVEVSAELQDHEVALTLRAPAPVDLQVFVGRAREGLPVRVDPAGVSLRLAYDRAA
jgi:alpha-L-fucosidase 2